MSRGMAVAVGIGVLLLLLTQVSSKPRLPTREELEASRMPQQPRAPTTLFTRPAPAPVVQPDEEGAPPPLPPLFVMRGTQRIALAGARARPMLLHLWASWCGPCRAELPSLLAYGSQGPVDVVAVSVDDHFEDVEKFFAGRIPKEVVWDDKITLEAALGVESLPTTFLVDRQGLVRDRFNGMQDWQSAELQRAVMEGLAPLPSPPR